MGIDLQKSLALTAVAGLVAGLTTACSKSPEAADPSDAAPAPHGDAADKACCAGKNPCAGKGGCKTATNDCTAKNQCEGKGGCSARPDCK
jgi:hypothetical protein